MRKLVVLGLVFGMASLANAGLLLNIAGNAATIDNVAPASTYQGFFAVVAGPKVLVTGGVPGPQAPDLTGGISPINDGSGVDALFPGKNGIWGAIASSSIAAGAPLPLGVFVSGINLAYTPGPEVAPVQVFALNEDGSVGQLLAEGTVNVVPEPATLAILGLGGLLLRRKK